LENITLPFGKSARPISGSGARYRPGAAAPFWVELTRPEAGCVIRRPAERVAIARAVAIKPRVLFLMNRLRRSIRK